MMHHTLQDVINENKRLVLEVANLHAQLDESNKLIDWLLIASPEQIKQAVDFAKQTTAEYKNGVYSLIREAFAQP
jgi:regulator of replication initiation timing